MWRSWTNHHREASAPLDTNFPLVAQKQSPRLISGRRGDVGAIPTSGLVHFSRREHRCRPGLHRPGCGGSTPPSRCVRVASIAAMAALRFQTEQQRTKRCLFFVKIFNGVGLEGWVYLDMPAGCIPRFPARAGCWLLSGVWRGRFLFFLIFFLICVLFLFFF